MSPAQHPRRVIASRAARRTASCSLCSQHSLPLVSMLLDFSRLWTSCTQHCPANVKTEQCAAHPAAQPSKPCVGSLSTCNGKPCKHACKTTLSRPIKSRLRHMTSARLRPSHSHLIFVWKQRMRNPRTPITTKLVIGAILVCTHR